MELPKDKLLHFAISAALTILLSFLLVLDLQLELILNLNYIQSLLGRLTNARSGFAVTRSKCL